jgi:hypothetical protein
VNERYARWSSIEYVVVVINENEDRRHATRRGLGSCFRSGYELETWLHRLRSYEATVFKDVCKSVLRDNNDGGREQAGRAPFCAFRPHRHSLSTDMHRALLLPEIVSAVVEDRGLADADLCTLARTCQAFTEPALDVLWRAHEEGEAALAQRMSAELWTIQPLEFEPDEVLPMEFIIDERCWQDILVCPKCHKTRKQVRRQLEM